LIYLLLDFGFIILKYNFTSAVITELRHFSNKINISMMQEY